MCEFAQHRGALSTTCSKLAPATAIRCHRSESQPHESWRPSNSLTVPRPTWIHGRTGSTADRERIMYSTRRMLFDKCQHSADEINECTYTRMRLMRGVARHGSCCAHILFDACGMLLSRRCPARSTDRYSLQASCSPSWVVQPMCLDLQTKPASRRCLWTPTTHSPAT